MKTLLIVGVDTVVGANLAASWSDRARVIGLSTGPEINISGCEMGTCERASADVVRKWLNQTQATHVVYCGIASRSSWEPTAKTIDDPAASAWANGAAESGTHFTLISSDAVFSGPWMFHEENSKSLCASKNADAIRETEETISEICPKSLVVRTNAFGWSPMGLNGGWLEAMLTSLEHNDSADIDPISHATPILATDLADCLEAALEDELIGTYHIAGADRVSPHQFATQLAIAFELNAPQSRTVSELAARPLGFGRGETSLQTRLFRKEYDCSMPLVSEGITRLVEQQAAGFRSRLLGEGVFVSRAA